jgi:glycosyltransferase involved in cell wall biosynthesis
MKISYAITVYNEIEEIKRLLSFLLQHKRQEDEIVVLMDSKGPDEIWEYLKSIGKDSILIHKDKFNNDFSEWKNQLSLLCSGDYIFNIDADEMPSENLIKYIPEIIEQNFEVLVYAVPRINTVEGITQEHIQKWRWNVNEKGWVNYPDYQLRIYKNDPGIYWQGKVHERLNIWEEAWPLPADGDNWALFHPKTIERQEKQNQLYDTI